ncbi:uncharacterized protein NESG_01833 [Nematocida ausubeli]|uniref:Uncharacterized protein n=1 Tax=Nematocida ausubeli (strain ATCC PRA-371 / ERTm2) TaxID=1913371 RepID=A0A086J127_NEMA1|nr:uncharacterized protein NESG_01833 [Nematocida ausubeli]KFG25845.1 hypothetical protein NESG_01833 [Nematocida ausubeli]
MPEDEFMRTEFSLDEYLSKILADASGECARLKDQHVRMLSHHAEALSCDMRNKKQEIREGLCTLAALTEEARRISLELPELFLPLLATEDPHKDEMHSALESEVQALHGDASISEGRFLKHKEHVTVTIDRVSYEGVLLVCADILIVGIKTNDGWEMYNALLIKEIQCRIEEDILAITLPPIRLEITKAENTLKHLLNKIHGTNSQKSTPRDRSISDKDANNKADDADKEAYADFLLQIGQVQTADPSIENLLQKIEEAHKRGKWKESSLLQALKRKSISAAVQAYCTLEKPVLYREIDASLRRKEPLIDILQTLHDLIAHYILGVEKVFPEPAAYGYIAVHLEEIHERTARLVYRLFYLCSASEEESVAFNAALIKAFTYDGYSYGYTARIGEEVRKDLLRSKYAFNKQVMQNIFKKIQL